MEMQKLDLVKEWDKTFPKSDKVHNCKVTFYNRFGITLASDLYRPKDAGEGDRLPAIAVCGPFGAVKEQCSGFYGQTMAERGFMTMVFDPSFTGESGGEPRYMASPDINTEDFMAAVDYLSCRDDVDPERIGIIGICGWGGMGVNAAALDTRIKATVAVTMYDMSRVGSKGYFDENDNQADRMEQRRAFAEARTKAYATGTYERAGGVADPVPDDAPQFVRDYNDYYKTERGYHPRSLGSNEGWTTIGTQSFLNQPLICYAEEIESAVMIVHGEKAHSCYMGKDTFARLKGDNKRLLLVPDAVHTDLYDGGGKDAIPFDEIQGFFEQYLCASAQ